MIDRHSEILFSQLSELIAARMGLYFPKARWHDLERGIASAAPEFGLKDVESCIQWLLSSPWTQSQIEILAVHLTVGETYFFREKRGFDLLEEHILPELIGSRRGVQKHLRIWSAGCATGEEPYSIAILLHQVLPDLKDWDITILATDMNPRFLQRASEGVYGEWSFRDTPIWIKERYFKKKESHRFEILPQIQRMVTFSYLNLAEDADPSFLNHPQAIDVIFCRNVLIYFAPERAKALSREPRVEEAAPGSLEVVEFLLAYERYGIESSYVREVCPLKELTPLPCTPPFVRGITSIRGQILSVLDLKRFFGLPERGLTDLNQVLLLHGDDLEFGLLADAILGVRSIPTAEIQPSLPTLTGIREAYLKGVTRERVVILDAGKLLSDKKMIVHEEVESS